MMALTGASAVGFLLADGEAKRLYWILAMRRCLLRISDIIRYERQGVSALLKAIELDGTHQEKLLTSLLHACAEEMDEIDSPPLMHIYAKRSSGVDAYGILSTEDREAFEQVIGELGQRGLEEQVRLIETADERLRQREESLRKDGKQRVRLIRTLGVCCGAGLFLVLI